MRNTLLNFTGLGGFALLGGGLWWLSPAVSMIIIGGLMLGGSIFSILKRVE